MMAPFSPRVSAALRLLALVGAAIPAQSLLWSSEVAWPLKAAAVALAVFAALRPNAALLVFSAVLPFSRPIAIGLAVGVPYSRLPEALALAFITGWIVSRFRRDAPGRALWPVSGAALVFAAALLVSAVVDIAVLRLWKDYWWPYLATIGPYFLRDYLTLPIDLRAWVGGVNGLLSPQAAALWLEGLALMWIACLSTAGDSRLWRRLVHVLTVAAVGAALLALRKAALDWTISGMALSDFIHEWRVSVHTSKVNVAASYYVLFLPVAAAWIWEAVTRHDGWRRALGAAGAVIAALVLFGGLWITGSRAGFVAAVSVVVLAAALHALGAFRPSGRRLAWPILGASGVALVFLGIALVGRASGGSSTWPWLDSLMIRVSMWQSAFRMLLDYPLFGVGVGHFRQVSTEYITDAAVRTWYSRGFPAHNQLVQIAAEMGLVGAAAAYTLLGGALVRAWRACRRTQDTLVVAVTAGIAAFLITSLAGNPFVVEVAAYPFWTMLGLVLAVDLRTGPSPTTEGRRANPWPRRVVFAALVLLVASVPFRVARAERGINFALVDYGLADDWSREGDNGREYKVVRGAATFFIYGQSHWLDVPVRKDDGAGESPVDLEIRLDGRVARQLTLTDREWQVVGFMIPPDAARPYRRVELQVTARGGVAPLARVGRPDPKRR